tara:strand:+ start:144 stop:791 length:648 start_codon:yes stop_codon:yes gene_type:complete
MSTKVYDSSAVDLYINELSRREAEVTRSRQIDNFIREVPFIALKWCAYILPIAILIWFLGNAISNALSFERIVKHESFTQGIETPIRGEEYYEDEIIDVEKILASAKSQDSYFPEDEEQLQAEAVRGYYIFDHLPFENAAIEEVIIGRKYNKPNSAAQQEFCYINIWQADGIGQRLNLITIDEEGRIENPLDESMAQKLNISLDELLEARAACTI